MENLNTGARRRKMRHVTREFRRVVRTGALVGVLLSAILTAWLFVANRVSVLERFAEFRNALAFALLFLAASIPVIRFRNSARETFFSGVIGIAMASLCYAAWTVYFANLADRMGAFRVFVEGVASYGLAAVVLWVISLCRSARHHHHHHVGLEPASRRRS